MSINLRRISLGANLIKKNHIMKKFFATFVLVVVSILTAMAADVYKVKYVEIGGYDRGTTVYCTNSATFTTLHQRQFTSFFNSLRAGDLVEVELKPYTNNTILAIRKVGHENHNGMTNGVIINDGSYGYGYGSASIETKNVGVGYDPYTGVHVRVKGNYVNIPVRIKSKKANNRNYTTVNNGGVVTASPATRPNVKTVSVDQLANITSNSVVRTSATVSTTKTVPARSSRKVKVYEVGTLPSAM